MGIGGVRRGPRIGLVFLPFGTWFQDLVVFCSRNTQDVACLLLDKGCADGMVGGRDIYQQGLADVWFVEDGG